ncbi:hypothetical protein FQN54_003340 [Arachnomyces sp. PD_36]|nr:hypothetical protein FQN54_003340 [Arachnomyces sp. PD_36]
MEDDRASTKDDTLSLRELERRVAELNVERERVEVSPTSKQLLGPFTVLCLAFNRTIGSGIFTVPSKVLAGTGSVGAALLLWASCGLIVICGALCWLELGLTLPFHNVLENGRWIRVSTPRSGGEKNWLEYIYKKPRFFMTCVYGIMFIVLGNISGNAVGFGIYVMKAAGHDDITTSPTDQDRRSVIGLAIGALTFCAGLHIFSRRGGILVNNAFAVVKIGMLLAIIVLGWVHAAGGLQNKGFTDKLEYNSTVTGERTTLFIDENMINSAAKNNFDIHTSFQAPKYGVSSFVESYLLIIFSYYGFDQPYYVLSEVRSPRKIFPKYTLLAMWAATILYVLVNISYLCVVPKETYISVPSNALDMAGTFFHYLFDSTDPETGVTTEVSRQVFSGFIAFSILGNILAITFTTARVKQEIAKEGILPFSLFFATGYTTPWAMLRPGHRNNAHYRKGSHLSTSNIDFENHLERAPMGALILHWFTSVLLIAVTSMLKPDTAYAFLVSLYGYVNVAVIGFLVSGGLLYLKLDSLLPKSRRNWAEKVQYKPWIDPLHVIVYFCAMSFFLFGAFAVPAPDSPFVEEVVGYAWYILPAIGLFSLFWGVVWWLGLKVIERNRRWKLDVRRVPYVEQDKDGNYVQKAELVEHGRLYVVGNARRRAVDVERVD